MTMFLTGLDRVARDAGLTVREPSGWKTRTAHKGGMTEVRGVLWHHTASPAAAVTTRNNPTLGYVIDGLGYPLCNYLLAWDGSLDVIAAGTGAHAGKGSYSGIPRDDGNRYLIGVEVEGTVGLTWSAAQLDAAARLGAALDREFGRPLLHIGHMEWAPGRKTDPTGIPGNMPALRAAIKRGHWNPTTTITPAATPHKEGTVTPEQMQELKDHIDNQIKSGLQWATVGYDGASLKKVLHEARTGSQAAYGGTVAQRAALEALTQVTTEMAASTTPLTPEDVKDMLRRIEDRAVEAIAADYEITRKEN